MCLPPQCPAQLITERELRFKVFANANALVPDPAAAFLAEDEVRPWSEAERRIFMEKFTMHPKVCGFRSCIQSPSGPAMLRAAYTSGAHVNTGGLFHLMCVHH